MKKPVRRAVIDQPGLKICVIGLFISLVFGLSLRSRISSNYVKIRLDQAVVRLQKDIFIDYNAVEVKLSDWGIPRPSVEVRGIRLSPRTAACADSQIYVESLSFPLTWNLLFSERKVISNLRLSQMEIRLADLQGCFDTSENKITRPQNDIEANVSVHVSGYDSHSQSDTPGATAKAPAPENLRPLPVLFRATSAAELDTVKIDQIKILFKNQYDWPIYLQSIGLNFTYEKSKLQTVYMKSQILALKDSERSLFRIKADLDLEAKSTSDNIFVQTHVVGRLLDRQYKLEALTNYQTMQMNYKIDVDQGSVKALYNVFRPQWYVTEASADAEDSKLLTGYTLSLQGSGEWDFEKSKNKSLKIDQLKIQNQDSFAQANPFTIESLRPFIVKNGQFRLERFDLSHLVNFFKTDQFPQVVKTGFRQYGYLTGDLIIQNQKLNIRGVVERSEIVFINKNERAVQGIDSFNFDMDYDLTNAEILANLHRFVLNDQKVNGDIRLSRVGKYPLSYVLNLKNLSFNSETAKLLFSTTEPSVFEIQSQFKDNRASTTIKSPQLKYRSFVLQDAWLNKIENLKTQQTQVHFKAQKLFPQTEWMYDPQSNESAEKVEGQEQFLYQLLQKANFEEIVKDITRIEWQSPQLGNGILRAQLNYPTSIVPIMIQMKKNDQNQYVLNFSSQQKTKMSFDVLTDKNWNSFQFVK